MLGRAGGRRTGRRRAACTPAATTRPASTRRRDSGGGSPTSSRGGTCCRSSTSRTRASATAWARTRRAAATLMRPGARAARRLELLQELRPLRRAGRRAVDRGRRRADDAKTLLSHAKAAVRANYSNPPAHGGEIVATIFADPELRARWEGEVTTMRGRIDAQPARARRRPPSRRRAGRPRGPAPAARDVLAARAVRRNRSQRLRDEFAVYVVGGGRVNVAGHHAGEPRAGVSRAGRGDAGAGRRRLTARPGRTFPVAVGAPTSAGYHPASRRRRPAIGAARRPVTRRSPA